MVAHTVRIFTLWNTYRREICFSGFALMRRVGALAHLPVSFAQRDGGRVHPPCK